MSHSPVHQGDPDVAYVLGLLDRGMPSLYPDEIQVVDLSPSETLVLAGLAAGLSTDQIAERAYLSVNTIKTHNRTLYRKLGVRSRVDALTRARSLGLRG